MADPNQNFVPDSDSPPQKGGESGQKLSQTPEPASSESWMDKHNFTEENKKIAGKYKTEGAFFEGMFNTARKVGDLDRIVEFPREGDPEFGRKMEAIHVKLGRPKEPKDYVVSVPEIPKHLEGSVFYNDSIEAGIKQACFKEGLSAGAVERLSKTLLEGQLQVADFFHKARIETASKLSEQMKAEMGAEKYARYFGTDEKDAMGNRTNTGLVGRMIMNRADGEQLWAELESTGLGNNPAVSRIFAEHAELTIGEGEIGKGSPGSGKTGSAELSQYERNKRDFPDSPSCWGSPDK